MKGWPLLRNEESDTSEPSLSELDAATGRGPVVEAMHYAQVVGALVAAYSQPAVEVETSCGKQGSHDTATMRCDPLDHHHAQRGNRRGGLTRHAGSAFQGQR